MNTPLIDADDVLHEAMDFAQLIVMAAASLQSDAKGPIMQGAEAVRARIETALDLVERAENQRITGGDRNG